MPSILLPIWTFRRVLCGSATSYARSSPRVLIAMQQRRLVSTKEPEDATFRSQLHDSTYNRLQQEREERERYSRARQEYRRGRNAATTFSMLPQFPSPRS